MATVLPGGKTIDWSPFQNKNKIFEILNQIKNTNKKSPIDNYLKLDLGSSANGTKFQDVLGGIQSGENSAEQLLALLLGAGNQSFTDERWDMLYQYLLQLMNTKDQRAFDISQLQDSRLYSNPTNELSRLMAAGVGRDAAIQILSGSAGSSGVGVAGSVGASAPSPTGISGTQDLNRLNTGFNIAINAISMLGQMLDCGVSMAQGIENTKMLQSQNALSQYQLQGFNDANTLVSQLQVLQKNGLLDSAEIEQISNGHDLINYLQGLAKDNQDIAQFVGSKSFQGTFSNIYGQEYFNRFWRGVRESRDSGTLADEFIRNNKLQNNVLELQPALIGAEMAKLSEETHNLTLEGQKILNDIAVGNANIEVLNKQGNWIQVQMDSLVRMTDAQVNLFDTQAYGLDVQNKGLVLNYEYNQAGFPIMKQNRIDELSLQAEKWNLIFRDPNNSEEYKNQLIRSWLIEPQNAADAAYLQYIHNSALGTFASDCPTLYRLATIFHYLGVNDAVRTSNGSASAAAAVIKSLPK